MNKRVKSIRPLITILFCLAGLAACLPLGTELNPAQPADRTPGMRASAVSPTATLQPDAPLGENIPEDLERWPQLKLPGGLKRIEPTPMKPVTGEVPDILLEEIIADLVQHLGVERSAIEVIRGEAVVWNDGSLGCPQPGMLYTQAQVNGYWVILLAGEQEYDYRAAESGYFMRCESRGLPPISKPGNPAS